MIYSLLAGIVLSFQFSVTKLYQARRGTSMRSSLSYTAICGLLTALLFWCISGLRIEFAVYSFLMALCMSACSTAYMLMGFRLMSMGAMAVYTLFLMIGTMIVPFLYGVLWLGERATILRWIGMVIITIALALQCIQSGAGSKKDRSALFSVLCILVFLCNGVVGVLTKQHQIETRYQTVNAIAFVSLANLTSSILSFIALVGLKIHSLNTVKQNETQKRSIMRYQDLILMIAYAGFNGLSYWLLLLANSTAPASGLFPVLTGSSVVLSAVAAWLAFGEKPTRQFVFTLLLVAIGTILFGF